LKDKTVSFGSLLLGFNVQMNEALIGTPRSVEVPPTEHAYER
jgi:hypothetical protein